MADPEAKTKKKKDKKRKGEEEPEDAGKGKVSKTVEEDDKSASKWENLCAIAKPLVTKKINKKALKLVGKGEGLQDLAIPPQNSHGSSG